MSLTTDPAAQTRPGTPSDLVLATSGRDAAAVAAVERHHAELAGRLGSHVEGLIGAARTPGGSPGPVMDVARERLVGFCRDELLPHAAAEEATLYPAAAGHDRARLLIDAMVAEHRVLTGLVQEVATTAEPVRAAAAAHALRVLFDVHLAKENDLVLPLLAADPQTSLADLLAGMHELLGGDAHEHEHAAGEAAEPATGGCGGACGCGGGGAEEPTPVLDVRAVPHAIRHATVFGAVEAVPVGGSLVLVAPHDPAPLLRQLGEREPGAFAVYYQERGPQAWRLKLTRGR